MAPPGPDSAVDYRPWRTRTQNLLLGAVSLALSPSVTAQPPSPRAVRVDEQPPALVAVVLENTSVRVLKAGAGLALTQYPDAVVVPLEDGLICKAGEAYWSGDSPPGDETRGPRIIVELKANATSMEAQRARPLARVPPSQAQFVGLSFRPLFANDRVTVVRGRMEADARESFHTHMSDTVVVHLSGGAIEDTANGERRINHWRPGDVEFEARGSSHSARNVGPAVDAVLITIKP
jgi:quercetin dioxygenase-like cupin family protein